MMAVSIIYATFLVRSTCTHRKTGSRLDCYWI